MLIFGMLIIEFQVLLELKKIHIQCAQSITEILLYFGGIWDFLTWVSEPLSKKKKEVALQ